MRGSMLGGWLVALVVAGPFNPTGVSMTPSRALIFVCDSKSELCFVQNLEGGTVLKVGEIGKNQSVLVSLEQPKR